MMKNALLGLALLVAAFHSGAATPGANGPAAPAVQGLSVETADEWCGTGPQMTERIEGLGRWSLAKERERREKRPIGPRAAVPGVRAVDQVFLMDADEVTAPFDNPIDLVGSSIDFTRTSATNFTARTSGLNFDADVGSLVATYNGWGSYSHALTAFSFPFYASSHSTIHIGSNRGVYMSAPSSTDFRQYGTLESVAQRIPVISPALLTPQATQQVRIYLKETSDSVTITWQTMLSTTIQHQIQAVLFSDGDIRFSYERIEPTRRGSWGALLITNGNESFYGSSTTPVNVADATGDHVTIAPTAVAPMVDLANVTVRRISSSPLLEFEIDTVGAIDPGLLPAGANIRVFISSYTGTGSLVDQILVNVTSSGVTASTYPGPWPLVPDLTVAIDGGNLKVRLLDELLQSGATEAFVSVQYNYSTTDSLDVPVYNLGAATAPLTVDFSALTTPVSLGGKPIVEAFTLPIINLQGVWDRLKTVYGFTDDQIDQVAVYQTFLTDITFYASGFSTGGNAAADGFSTNISSTDAKSPALMHLGMLGNPNAFLLTHEFGHRWLFFTKLREGGVDTNNLHATYDRGHPKQGVHTPAAFLSAGADASSPMGGARFTRIDDTHYQSGARTTYGFSWYELYLMGLASPAEISETWFYLNGTGLEGSYWPATNATFEVTAKTDFTLQQIIDAMGARSPAYGTAPTAFPTAFVILERPDDRMTTSEVSSFVSDHRDPWVAKFDVVTGGRGSIITDVLAAAPEITSFSPTSGGEGATVTISGSRFTGATAVSFNGVTASFSVVSNVEITATVPAGATTGPIVVTNAVGTATSASSFTVTGCEGPAITGQPASVAITSGDSTLLSVTASGTDPLSYQWYVGASGVTTSPIGGATSSSVTVTPASTTNYWVRVTNGCGTEDSAAATVTVTSCDLPVIVSQPAGGALSDGGLTLSVSATGTGTLTYQWYEGDSGDISNPVPGAHANSLYVTPAATTSYWVRVSDDCGSTDSAAAVVSVGGMVDPNGDGAVNVADIFYLINYLFAGGAEPLASGDANGDGTVSVADIFYLINHLFAGGPAPV